MSVRLYLARQQAKVVPGANQGIGLAASQVIVSAAADYHVIMTGRDLSKVERAIAELRAMSEVKGTLSALQLNVTDPESVTCAAQIVRDQHGGLDALVNNAGVGGLHISDVAARMKLCMDTNVVGPAVVSSAFRPLLLQSPHACSIYVTSGGGSITRTLTGKTVPRHGGDAYQCSKAALNMLAVQDWLEWTPRGIRVFAMSPGFVVTNLRGTSEEERSGWGASETVKGDPMVAGKTILDIICGKRDEDMGKLVVEGGVYPW